MNQIKVPQSIQEVFAEAAALEELARQMNSAWWFSPKAFVYQKKAIKARQLVWRALKAAYPIVEPHWRYDHLTGIVSDPQSPSEPKPKQSRKPRTPKVVAPAV